MVKIRRLLIVSHVVHYEHGGRWFAYGPYAREIDVWADLFPEIVIAAPLRREQPPGDAMPFTRENISFSPQMETGGNTLLAKVIQLLAIPGHFWRLARAMRRADAIHVRCPGNLGLLGCVLAPFFRKPRVAKYAGQWSEFEGEPLSWRFQKRLLRSRWWHAPVTVYGKWPNQPPHVIPFFTSVMSAGMVGAAVRATESKRIESPLRVLFSGRLSAEKRAGCLLEAARLVGERGVAMELVLVGDGPEAGALRRQANQLGLGGVVRFAGGLPYEKALEWNQWAHCLVLPSMSEGWPKVVAEAMCHGVVCIAGAHGQVPDMLDGRGIALTSCTPEQIADSLCWVARHPAEALAMGQRASLWSRGYSLEGLREALRSLLEGHWHRKLGSVPHA